MSPNDGGRGGTDRELAGGVASRSVEAGGDGAASHAGASGEIASGLASLVLHDLSNMLAVAESSVYLAKGALDDRAYVERQLARVEKQLRKAQELAVRCLAVSRGEAVDKVELTFAALWEEVASGLIVPPPLTLEVAHDVGLALACEPLLLSRVLANLIDNAVHALTPHGRGTVSIEARRDGAQVRVEVRDDGPGLPPGLAFSGRTTKAGGSGLGLLVSRAVVAAHGGTLELVPSARGACFRLLLPVA